MCCLTTLLIAKFIQRRWQTRGRILSIGRGRTVPTGEKAVLDDSLSQRLSVSHKSHTEGLTGNRNWVLAVTDVRRPRHNKEGLRCRVSWYSVVKLDRSSTRPQHSIFVHKSHAVAASCTWPISHFLASYLFIARDIIHHLQLWRQLLMFMSFLLSKGPRDTNGCT